MLRDITIGQYYNTKSPIHSLDVRVKIISLIVLMVAIFMVNSFFEYAVITAFILALIFLSRVPFGYILRGMKPVLFLIAFTAVINLFFGGGETVLFEYGVIKITKEAVILALSMMMRVMLLVTMSNLLTLTSSPMIIAKGIEKLLKPLEKIKFPSHEVAMMMSIALRFIPTLTDEAEKIMKAQASRGNDLESGGIVKKAKGMIPLFVPLFVSAFRRADELAMAMECRCYNGGKNRTSFNNLRYKKIDVAAYIIVVLVVCITFADRVFGAWI